MDLAARGHNSFSLCRLYRALGQSASKPRAKALGYYLSPFQGSGGERWGDEFGGVVPGFEGERWIDEFGGVVPGFEGERWIDEFGGVVPGFEGERWIDEFG